MYQKHSPWSPAVQRALSRETDRAERAEPGLPVKVAGQGRQPELFLITFCIHKACNTYYNIKIFALIIIKLNN